MTIITSKIAKNNVSLVYINMLTMTKAGKSRTNEENKRAPKTDLTTYFIFVSLSINLTSFLKRLKNIKTLFINEFMERFDRLFYRIYYNDLIWIIKVWNFSKVR